jgi:MFS family permease
MAAATLVSGPRAVALASAVAPPSARGRYLAAFQYAFTAAGVVAPAIVALYSVAVWLPWALVAASTSLAIVGLRALARHLPAAVLTPATTLEPSPKVPRPRDSPRVPPNLPKAEAEIPCR